MRTKIPIDEINLDDIEIDPVIREDSIASSALNLINSIEEVENDQKTDNQSENHVREATKPHPSKTKTKNGVKLVQYDPNSKPARLGRPRSHITNPITEPLSDSSSQNEEGSIISKFRFDNQPLEGPGSRGGQKLRKSPRGKITSEVIKKKQKTQSTLNFGVLKSPSKSTTKEQSNSEENDKTTSSSKTNKTLSIITASDSKYKQRSRLTEDNFYAHRNETVKKTFKPLPSPIIPISLFTDLLSVSDQSRIKDTNKLALGFPVRKNPYASDITYLIEYLTKFKDIISIKPLGPQDFEEGLSLPTIEDTVESERYNKKDFKDEVDNYDVNYISPDMQKLYKILLTLVLNRKKDVTIATAAMQELKPKTRELGLPREWKIYDPTIKSTYEAGEPVDRNCPDILIDEWPKDNDYKTKYNPFYDNHQFAALGLSGLENPADRLILLRTLAQWSLTESVAINEYIHANIQKQELPGDKDTFYVPRSVIYGFDNCIKNKDHANHRLSKMKSTEEDLKYVDPTSDPNLHTMNLRLVNHFAGDLGFHNGRFYLCRMSDSNNGGLSSVEKMNETWKNPNPSSKNLPSNFKLYLQDVFTVVKNSLKADGVEFDNDENEIVHNERNNYDSDDWYEVASTPEELKSFIDFLQTKIDEAKSKSSDLLSSIKKLHEFLKKIYPLLEKQDQLIRSAKNRKLTGNVVVDDEVEEPQTGRRLTRAQKAKSYAEVYDEDEFDDEEEEEEDDEIDEDEVEIIENKGKIYEANDNDVDDENYDDGDVGVDDLIEIDEEEDEEEIEEGEDEEYED
ncbi:hypothetical protein KGF54_003211 [Candida jiufengensis]|uniref:uncharacterized protein n=1 Tax=Candida jiufengensis TaxID=497108 RepID=UPI0022257F89|nr:uncharacterized protein KGF54_003211 [Candida jiufengensis]KAI5952345.1 hypothetical protein KGF54_003211 [Candida jiufengensis]